MQESEDLKDKLGKSIYDFVLSNYTSTYDADNGTKYFYVCYDKNLGDKVLFGVTCSKDNYEQFTLSLEDNREDKQKISCDLGFNIQNQTCMIIASCLYRNEKISEMDMILNSDINSDILIFDRGNTNIEDSIRNSVNLTLNEDIRCLLVLTDDLISKYGVSLNEINVDSKNWNIDKTSINNSFARFSKDIELVNTFNDIKEKDWYYTNVVSAYQMGLVKGANSTTFNPNGNITIAETIALACRLNSVFETSSANFEQGTPWYQVYVDYALDKGIIDSNTTNFEKKATRAEFATILAKVFPRGSLPKINGISETPVYLNKPRIPDIQLTNPCYVYVTKLYNAGILTGSDKFGTFHPESNITRAEVATIVNRMAVPAERKLFTLQEPVTELSLAKASYDMYYGDGIQLSITIGPSYASDLSVTFSSSNNKVATVDKNGHVIGVGVGKAIITVKATSGKTATCMVNVKKYPSNYTDYSLANDAIQRLKLMLYVPSSLQLSDVRVVSEKYSTPYKEVVKMTYTAQNRLGVPVQGFSEFVYNAITGEYMYCYDLDYAYSRDEGRKVY